MRPSRSAESHLLAGNSLSFGKLTMADRLGLVDLDPKDPFDFSVTTGTCACGGVFEDVAKRGLRAYMPDYNDLKEMRPLQLHL